MKRACRILSMILACVLVFSLCACGGNGGKNALNNQGKTENGKTVWYMGGNNGFSNKVKAEELFNGIEDTVKPAEIYNTLDLTEEMLHGVYMLNNKDEDIKTVRETIPFKEVVFPNATQNLTILPTAVYLGADNLCSSSTNYKYSEYEAVKDHEVAVLELATEDKIGRTPCTYEISGNTITFKQINQTSGTDEPFAYEFTGVEFQYDFELKGPYMTFSKDGYSLQLKAFCMTENTDEALSMHGYSLPNSPLIESLDYFASSDSWNYAVRRDGSYVDLSAYKLDDEGRFTVFLQEKNLVTGEKETVVKQYAYILQSEGGSFLTDFGIILLDGEKVYYYTDDITQREARALEEQGADADKLTEEEIKEIAEKKSNLLDDLYKEFQDKGIAATINRSTGEIALDSTVLFDVNETAVSEEGKAFLTKFMDAFASVVLGEKYEGFISKIMVEGHTDTNGSYDRNLQLSNERADNVKAYFLSADCGVDANYTGKLQDMLVAMGYAYDKPVYDENGEVDMDASRRVSFRFVVNLEKQG